MYSEWIDSRMNSGSWLNGAEGRQHAANCNWQEQQWSRELGTRQGVCVMCNGQWRCADCEIDWDLKYTLRKMHTHIEKSRKTERGENTHSRQPQLAIHLQTFQRFLKWFKLKFNLLSILNSVFLLKNSAVPWALQLYEKRKYYFCFSAAQRKVCCCVGVSIYVCVWVCVWESEKSVEELLKVASCVFSVCNYMLVCVCVCVCPHSCCCQFLLHIQPHTHTCMYVCGS